MSYSGSVEASQARERLGQALAVLQEDPNIPPEVMAVAQNIAQSVGALFEAERASSEPDGKTCIRNALSSLSQTLALLQDVRGQHRGIELATEVIAKTMSELYPLTTRASRAPQPMPSPAAGPAIPPAGSPGAHDLEANVGATTVSNFFVGFSGEVAEGGVFLATYEVLPKGSPVNLLVTLPGGFEFRVQGYVRFVREPLDVSADAQPGMGIQFRELAAESRELVLRFIRKRPPMFYDE